MIYRLAAFVSGTLAISNTWHLRQSVQRASGARSGPRDNLCHGTGPPMCTIHFPFKYNVIECINYSLMFIPLASYTGVTMRDFECIFIQWGIQAIYVFSFGIRIYKMKRGWFCLKIEMIM